MLLNLQYILSKAVDQKDNLVVIYAFLSVKHLLM